MYEEEKKHIFVYLIPAEEVDFDNLTFKKTKKEFKLKEIASRLRIRKSEVVSALFRFEKGEEKSTKEENPAVKIFFQINQLDNGLL